MKKMTVTQQLRYLEHVIEELPEGPTRGWVLVIAASIKAGSVHDLFFETMQPWALAERDRINRLIDQEI